MTRRVRLAALVLGTTLGAGAQTAAPPAAKAYFQLHTVAPGVYAAIAVPGSGAGSNSGFIVGDAAVCVVDTFQNVDAARALVAAIHAQTPLPIRYVINTHYHIDHVTGNRVFADAGAVILAQTHVRAWIHSENRKFLGDHPTPQRLAMVADLRAPDVTYEQGIDLYLGGREVEVRVLPGHTGGDSALKVDGTPVVFTGDLFWQHSLPNLIDANTALQIASLTQLEQWADAGAGPAVFVPGHGNVGTAADLAAFRDYLTYLRAQVADARARGLSGSALAASLQPAFTARYGDWTSFSHFIGPNLLQTDAELAGTKRFPGH